MFNIIKNKKFNPKWSGENIILTELLKPSKNDIYLKLGVELIFNLLL